MKGHIFRLLEDFIVETAGHDAFDEIAHVAHLARRVVELVGDVAPPDADVADDRALALRDEGLSMLRCSELNQRLRTSAV